VQSFAQQSGGDVSLLAGAQGGARFLIRLPARAGRAPEQAAPLPSSATQAMLESLDQPRVLIVDDDDAVRHLVRRQVERLGFMASDLATATEALDTLAREERFDLLLSDVVLGTEIDGLELGMRAKALRPELLVVYMTGYTERSYELEGERWLSKPFTSRGLETVLRETLDRSDAGGKQSIH
jgi:CheY-like chemotaxis protein